MRRAGLIQLKSGDAISGVVSHKLPWYRFLRVEMAELHEDRTQTTTRADGDILVPKSNVLFIQELHRVIEGRALPTGKAELPGPLTSPPRESA